MLQKLKQKLHRKNLSITALFVLLLSSFLFLLPNTSMATDIPLSNITVKTDTLTKTSSGLSLSNLVRVGKNEQITFTVRLTLLSPAGGIVLNTDKVDYDLGANQPFPIIEFGAGVDKVNGNTCKEKAVTSANIQGFIPFVGSDNKTYMSCSFPGGTRTITGKVDANKTYDLTFTASANSLGLDNTQIGTKQSFVVYPYLRMELWGPNANSVFKNSSKEIYVEFFNTPEEAQAAITQNKPAPSGVPNYGSNTGSGETNNTGSGLVDLINRIIGFLLGIIQEFIYAVFFWLIAPLIQAMLSIHPYTDTFVAVIYPGWEVIRNLCNIFFILALIIIAMATLFRVDSYKFKDLIIQLIVAALLVNFSLVIAQVILGLADTFQAQFLPANVTVIRSLAADLMVNNWRAATLQSGFGSQGTFAATVQPLFYLALSLGSFAVFAAICIFLVIRVVALWMLLMISPIAYAVGVLPATAKFRGLWWDNFLKYAFFTPIMAFFLNMAAVISNTTRDNPVLKDINGLDLASSLGEPNIASFVLKVGSNLLLLVFLFVAIVVAEKAGIYGASGITELAKKGMLAPFGVAGALGKKGLGYAGRKYAEQANLLLEQHGEHKPTLMNKAMFALMRPDKVLSGWQKRTEELSHLTEGEAEAGGREVAEQLLTWGKLQIPYRQFIERKDEDEFLRDYGNMKKESLMSAALAAEKLSGPEGEKRRRAIIKAAAKNGYLDDMLRVRHFAEQYRDDDGTIYSAEVLNRFLYGYLGHGEQTYRMLAEDFEQIGKDTGHYEYLGHAYFDTKNKLFKNGMEEIHGATTQKGQPKMKNTWQANFAAGELKKAGGRSRAGIAPHNLVPLRAKMVNGEFVDSNPTELDESVVFGSETGELDEYSRAILGVMDAGTLRDAHYFQSRMKEWIFSKNVDKNTGEIIVSSEYDVHRIESLFKENPAFVKAMYGQSTGLDVQKGDVSGVKITILDAAGKRDSGVVLGTPKANALPVGNALKTAVGRAEINNITPVQQGLLNTLVSSEAENIYKNNNSVNIDQQIATIANGNAQLELEIKNKIHSIVAEQYEQVYNPIPVITDLDSKYKFSAAQISALNRDLSIAAKSSYEEAVKQGVPVTNNVTRVQVAKVLQNLANQAGNQNIGSLTQADIDYIANHMAPTQ